MSDRSRDRETQRYESEYDTDAFLEAIRECNVASTSNVADEIGCDQSTAYRRLAQLEESGDIGSEKVGGATRVWFIPE